jgi:hypothetical protein
MGLLAMHNPNVDLRQVIIPGTHSSASCSISKQKLMAKTGRHQSLTITDQLNKGVRFFDIRCGKNGNRDFHFSVASGAFSGGDVLGVFSEIISFCQEHPHEFIIIGLVNELNRGLTSKQKLRMFNVLTKALGPYMVKGKDADYPEFKASFSKISKVSFSKKQILMVIDPSFYGFKQDG